MQRNDQARKTKVIIDGSEILDLVKLGEINFEDLSVEVPSFDKIRTILSGTEKINPITMNFKIRRDSETIKLIRAWRSNRQIKDVTIIETDGTGVEYHRLLLPQCEAGNMKLPEYDASSPTYAQAEIVIYPFDRIDID